MMIVGKYEPLIKSKNFLPNPVIINGIPPFANSKRNPSVKGTAAHRQWWLEQFRRCIFGYETGGMFITGRYYNYLNFGKIYTVGKGLHPPDIIDLDIERFNLIDFAKKQRQGLISLKARRKGMSFITASIIDHGMRFANKYEAGVCAGLDTHVNDFRSKFDLFNKEKPPELKLHYLTDNTEKVITGWKQKGEFGWEEGGVGNTLYCETMFNNAGKFKGKKLEDCIFEETGEFDLLLKSFEASKPCFMDGDDMIGTPFLFGTGGNIKTSSKDFKSMWYNAEYYNLIKLPIMADRMYFPCVAGHKDADGILDEDIPNLKKQYPEPWMRIGMEDTRQATIRILKKRKLLEKNQNKKAYYAHIQNFPLNEKESFMTFSGNQFDTVSLNSQLHEIDSLPSPKWSRFHLDWATDEKGKIKYPLEVVTRELKRGDHSECFLYVHKPPATQYKNLDIAGLDSYDLDESETTPSLGSMVVYRRLNMIPNMDGGLPVALIYCRPKRKELFYDLCAKTAVYYGLMKNVLIDIDKPSIIEHFKNLGLKKYLARRPKSVESIYSKQIHEFGFKQTGHSKPQMMGLLQSWVLDHSYKCWFEQVINDLLSYDVEAKFSDWDSADALGIALIRDMDMKALPGDTDGAPVDISGDMPIYKEDANGNIVIVNRTFEDDPDQYDDPFLKGIATGHYK